MHLCILHINKLYDSNLQNGFQQSFFLGNENILRVEEEK